MLMRMSLIANHAGSIAAAVIHVHEFNSNGHVPVSAAMFHPADGVQFRLKKMDITPDTLFIDDRGEFLRLH